jgi:hypothetical protein
MIKKCIQFEWFDPTQCTFSWLLVLCICAWNALYLTLFHFLCFWCKQYGIDSVRGTFVSTIRPPRLLPMILFSRYVHGFGLHIPLVPGAFFCNRTLHWHIGMLTLWGQHSIVAIGLEWVLFVGGVCPIVTWGMSRLLLQLPLWNISWMFVLWVPLNSSCDCLVALTDIWNSFWSPL